MSEEGTPIPSDGAAPDAGPVSDGAAGVIVTDGAGTAPGAGSDAPVDPAAAAAPAIPAFSFGGRSFRDQKHAEEIFGSEVGRTRTLQRQVAAFEKQTQEARAEIAALRGLIPQAGNGRGQTAETGPKSFADELAASGELGLIAKLAQDPDNGMAKAMYAMAQAMDKRVDAGITGVRTEMGEITQHQKTAGVVARGLTASKKLAETFPEIQDYGDAASDEIVAAQQEILDDLARQPEMLRADPERALWNAVMWYREKHGTPDFAQAPGSSGSPSALIAQAAENAAQAGAATPIDGSGVPRQDPGGRPETAADRWRRESAALPKEATTPSGRSLGFEVS